jgi:diguanylate cyclase (GGDEF)-like protein
MLRGESPGKTKVLLSVLAVLALAASVIVIWNIVRLRGEINDRTKRYVSDVSVQLADSIDSRLANIADELRTLGDGLLQMSHTRLSERENLENFLERKAQMLGFSSFVLADTDGNVFQPDSSSGDTVSISDFYASFSGENGVSLLEGEGILYTVPLYQEDRIVGAIGGIREKEKMQELIQSVSFSGSGITCIADSAGEIVITPAETEPFVSLGNFLAKNTDETVSQELIEMREDIAKRQPGIFRFVTSEGLDMLIAYNPLEAYRWDLFTLVPGNVVSVKVDRYIREAFFSVTLIVFLMALFMGLLYAGLQIHHNQVEQIAFVDPVTGGMNNAAFQFRCRSLLPKAPPNTYAVILLNIKKFKLVNMEFGSDQGDALLRHIMAVIQDKTEGKGFAARMHADMFYLCLKESDRYRILGIVDEIAAEVKNAVRLLDPNQTFPLILQSGVYVVEDPKLEITVMQDRARVACRSRSETEDGVCLFFNDALYERLEHEQKLNGMFEQALERREFQVFLQPKVWLQSGRIGGAEALVRWQNPEVGMILPGDFIPLFETNGKIRKLDLYVFEEVCRIVRRWLDSGKPALPISVNLSRQHFQQADFLKHYAEISRRYRIPEGILELELTESIFFDDERIEEVKDQIRRIHELGFCCSLDDFGTGFSSLGLLKDFDIDTIKVDRRFSQDTGNRKTKEILASITELSRKLNIRTVVEGIETEEQLRLMREVACDLIQGFIYARPMPISEFEAWCVKYGEGAG